MGSKSSDTFSVGPFGSEVPRLGVLGDKILGKKFGSVFWSWVGLELGRGCLPYPSHVIFDSFPLFLPAFLRPFKPDWSPH